MRWKIYNERETEVKLPNMHKPWLAIPEKTLPFGIYTLNFTVLINEFQVTATALKYIKVLKTPLKLNILGGTARSVNLNEDLLIDASHSVDEDGGDIDEFSFRIKKSFSKNWKTLATQKQFSRSKRSSCGFGCFSTPPPGIGQYVIQVQAQQGNQIVSSNQKLVIVDYPSFHPNLDIQCLVNCKRKIDYSKKFILETLCNNCPSNIVWKREWLIFLEHENGSLSLIDTSQYKSTPLNSEYLGLKGGFFESGKVYTIRTTWISGSLYGFSERRYVTNLSPYGGKCRVEPKQGRQAKNIFKIFNA